MHRRQAQHAVGLPCTMQASDEPPPLCVAHSAPAARAAQRPRSRPVRWNGSSCMAAMVYTGKHRQGRQMVLHVVCTAWLLHVAVRGLAAQAPSAASVCQQAHARTFPCIAMHGKGQIRIVGASHPPWGCAVITWLAHAVAWAPALFTLRILHSSSAGLPVRGTAVGLLPMIFCYTFCKTHAQLPGGRHSGCVREWETQRRSR
eukprot:jgi/Ulvmu1/10630/UM066_0009.1